MCRDAGVSGFFNVIGLYRSLCLDLDAISSGDSEAGPSSAVCICPVLRVDEEFAVISVHSSDIDPDSSDERCPSDSQGEPVLPVPEQVVLSAISSVRISPNQVQVDCSSETLVYPVYQVSPDTSGYVPATAPVMPPSSDDLLPASGSPDRRLRCRLMVWLHVMSPF